MQEKINNYLDRPFLLFLSYRLGRIYFIALVIFFAFFLNVFQPFGLTNWHAFHKSLFLSGYSLVLIGSYAVVYIVYSLLRPTYFRRESWTIRKELHILSIYIPLAALFSWIYTDVYVAEIDFSLSRFLALQFYNSLISIGTILSFGYFVSTSILKSDKELSPVTLRASEGMINYNTPEAVTDEASEDMINYNNTVDVTDEVLEDMINYNNTVDVTDEASEDMINNNNTVDVTDEVLEDMINNNNTVDVTEPPTEVLPTPPEPTGYIIIKREKIDVSTILFASSDRNTISIYILQRGNVRKLTKIMTLKAFTDLVDAYPYMKSCSVSFIVNINQIELWSGTSTKMTLYMKGCNLTVPVTKGSIPCFTDLMNELGIMKKQ